MSVSSKPATLFSFVVAAFASAGVGILFLVGVAVDFFHDPLYWLSTFWLPILLLIAAVVAWYKQRSRVVAQDPLLKFRSRKDLVKFLVTKIDGQFGILYLTRTGWFDTGFRSKTEKEAEEACNWQ